MANVTYTNVLGLVMEDTLTCHNHTDQLITRLKSSFSALRAVKAMSARKTLRIIYLSHVHSIISYGTIVWGNTTDIIKILRKKVIKFKKLRIIPNSKKMDSCRELFITMEILPFYAQ
jgi:hypothetical protein